MRKNNVGLALVPLLVAACSDGADTANDDPATTATVPVTTATMTAGATSVTATSAGTTVTTAAATSGTTTGTSSGVTGTGGATSATTAPDGTTTDSVTTGTGGMTSAATSGSGGTTATSGGGAGGTGGNVPGTCPYTPPQLPETFPADWSSDEVILFNDDGAWTWYSDERAVVDAESGKLIVSSDANGSSRNGNVDVVIHDIASGENDRFMLGDLNPDDHNNAAILVKGPGEYLAFWAGHNENCNSYWRNYSGGTWGSQQIFNWSQHSSPCPWSNPPRSVTYNNLWNMSAENKIYNFSRTVDTSPNLLVSSDDGASWTYGGRLTATPQVGYVAGYYKYWGNGVDRVDFLATDNHPRDYDNNLYHGYVQGGKIYNSTGEVIDDNLSDATAKEITDYTKVYATGTQTNGLTLNFLWNIDIVRYEDGTIAALWKARNNGTLGQSDPDHRMLYSRFDGTSWTATYLAKAGKKLYDSEQDYIGLGALDPDDPHVIYISTPYDPRDDTTDLGQHEIWKGVTCDDGATFTWTPVTMNSGVDNLRPIVPKWDAENSALLWFRGSYSSAQSYNEEVVGIISQR